MLGSRGVTRAPWSGPGILAQRSRSRRVRRRRHRAGKIPARPCQLTPSPARQLGLIRAVTGDARLALRWLALRGAPRAIAVYQTYLLSSDGQDIRDVPFREPFAAKIA